MHDSWEQSKKRFKALWHNEIVDRCCVRVTGWKNGPAVDPYPLPESLQDRRAYWLDGEQILKRELYRMDRTYFAGEAFPHINANFGAAGHAAYFKGTRVDFQDSIWIRPFQPANAGVPFTLEFDPNSLLYRKTFEVIQYLVDQSQGRYFISMTDIAGNLDALAHIRQSDTLLLDMAIQPDMVLTALNTLMSVWKEVFLRVWHMTKANNDSGSTIGWLDTWAPGFHGQMQCDISVMISPQMFETFVIPELREQCDFMHYPLYHLDGIEQIRHLDHLLSLKKLRMIQWTHVTGQPSPVEYIPVLKRIQQAGKALLVRLSQIQDIEPLMAELSSRGLYLYIEPILSSQQEAEEVVNWVTRWTHD